MRPEIERVSPQNLEIALIERFKKIIQEINGAAGEAIQTGKFSEEDCPSELAAYKNAVHHSSRECAEHNTDEIYIHTESETGETITLKGTIYERFDDNRVDITGMVNARIRVENGLLVESSNPAVLRNGLEKLDQIKQSLEQEPEPEDSDIISEAYDLMGEIISRKTDKIISLNIESSQGIVQGWTMITGETVVFGIKGQNSQIEYTYGESFFKAAHYSYDPDLEPPHIVEYGWIGEDGDGYKIENLAFLQSSLGFLRSLNERLSQDPPTGLLPEPIEPESKIKPAQNTPVEVLIAQTKPF